MEALASSQVLVKDTSLHQPIVRYISPLLQLSCVDSGLVWDDSLTRPDERDGCLDGCAERKELKRPLTISWDCRREKLSAT